MDFLKDQQQHSNQTSLNKYGLKHHTIRKIVRSFSLGNQLAKMKAVSRRQTTCDFTVQHIKSSSSV